MQNEDLINGDPELLTSILNSVAGNGELPAGVTILKKLEVDAEVKAVFETLKKSPTFEEDTKENPNLYNYEIKEDIGGVVPVESYTVVSDKEGHGIVALPRLIILFEAGGDLQVLNSDPIWFVFSNVSIADEIILETQETVDEMFGDEGVDDQEVEETEEVAE